MATTAGQLVRTSPTAHRDTDGDCRVGGDFVVAITAIDNHATDVVEGLADTVTSDNDLRRLQTRLNLDVVVAVAQIELLLLFVAVAIATIGGSRTNVDV